LTSLAQIAPGLVVEERADLGFGGRFAVASHHLLLFLPAARTSAAA
jgi:hypothetical protein